MKFIYSIIFPSFFLLIVINFAGVNAEPNIVDPHFKIDKLFSGHFLSSSMAFLGEDDILVLDRDEGKVYRFTDGVLIPKALLDVNVATSAYRGMLGIATTNDTNGQQSVFLYFTEAKTRDGDDANNTNPVDPLGNRLYKYRLKNDSLADPKLLLDLPALPGPRHNGGVIAVGPNNNIYLTVGDIDGTFRGKKYETMAQNYQNGSIPDGRSRILIIDQEGKPAANGTLGDQYPLNLYYAYGIRNSFGIDWDPETGHLWDSENGPDFGDELNLVEPGFNSGWVSIQGIWKPDFESIGPVSITPENLVDFNGTGKYRAPEFNWIIPVGPSAIRFFNSDKFGLEYKNDLFVGDSNDGNIYHFDLNESRTGLQLSGLLKDKVANDSKELENVIYANGFGQITDIKVGPDGYLYVLASAKKMTSVYRISQK